MKTNLDSIFKTDKSVESEGVRYEISEGVAFKIKRFGGFNAPKIKQALARYYKPYAKQIENGTFDMMKEREIMYRVFVESCVTGWEGIEIDGKQEPFTVESCVKLFIELPDMAEVLISHASDFKNYREEVGN